MEVQTIKVNGVELVKRKTSVNDCRGCHFSVGDRFKDCPEQCCMSTKDNEPVIYTRK